MSKKTFFLIILIILALFGGLYWYMFSGKTAAPTTQTTSGGNNLFPFGAGGSGNQNQGTTTGGTGGSFIDITGNAGNTVPRLRHISSTPTAGGVIFNTGSSTIIRYLERATGHIYETKTDALETVKISAVTIPKVHEALWTRDGSKLLVRYLKDDNQTIRTFYAKIATTTKPEQALEGLFLTDGIKNVSVFGNKIFYTNEASNGAQGIVANIDGSNKNTVFSSTFSDWSSIWTSTDGITLFTRPSGIAEGVAYTLNPQTGVYIKTVGEIKGLTTLGNSDGSVTLLSRADGNSIVTGFYTKKTGVSDVLGVSTLTDKCIWSTKEKTVVFCAVPQFISSGTYPDDWYKGKISFNDALWRINTADGSTEQLFSTEFETGVSMDMTKLSLDQAEKTIIFTNKKDMTVWSYRLVE